MKSTTEPPRIVTVRQGVLRKNDELARGLRDRFTAAGVFVVNLVSGPGAGKTGLLERTLTRLRETGQSVAALVGDLETDCDARRLARSGAPVRQIVTHNCCHLDAQMVADHLAGWDLAGLDFLFVENVGNLVCPASYDLGEHLRVTLFAVTDGEDKPLKYPTIFNSSDVVVFSKLDLAAAAGFDRAAAETNVQAVRPGVPVLATSARSGEGVGEWIDFLKGKKEEAMAGPESKSD